MKRADARTMKRADALTPAALMGLCRANGKVGGWEPEAIEHWRWQFVNGDGRERVLAWVKLNSIARASKYCRNDSGRLLSLHDCARDLALQLQTVRNYASVLVAEGRMRLQNGVPEYQADVPETAAAADPVTGSIPLYRVLFPGYLVDFYEKQRPEKQAQMIAEQQAFNAWQDELIAEAVAAAREFASPRESNMVSGWGASKNRIGKKAAAEKPKSKWLQLALLAEPQFVQSKGTRAVSGMNLRVYETIPRPVQSDPSFMPFNPTQPRERTPPPSPTETGVSEVVMVSNRLSVNMTIATKILRNVRAVAPSLPALAVIHLAEEKLRRSPGVISPVGLLLKTLADEAVGPPLAKAIEAARREDERAVQAAENAAANVSKDRSDAERILADPEAAPFEVEWAQEILTKAKGAGDAN